MNPRPGSDQPDSEPLGGDSSGGDPSAMTAAERIIERFGGIRPMAHKLEVPVTTVQGWKKRGAIPTVRHADLLAAATRHGITIEPAELEAAAPAEERGAGIYPASGAAEPTTTEAAPIESQLNPAPEPIHGAELAAPS